MVIYQRTLDGLEFTPIPGTEGAYEPFYSHDGQWVAFFADDKLKKVPLSGGVAVTVCELPALAANGYWGDDDTIVFVGGSTLYRVPGGGGTPELVAEAGVESGYTAFRWPVLLPGSRTVIVTARSTVQSDSSFHIVAVSLDDGSVKPLLEGGTYPRYVETGLSRAKSRGHLVYAQEEGGGFTGGLLAVPFDAETVEVTGSPIPVEEGVRVHSGGAANYDISRTGHLAFLAGTIESSGWTMAWAEPGGPPRNLAVQTRRYFSPDFSPDGQRVAVEILDNPHDIYVLDLRRGALSRLTFESGNHRPAFTPDGKRVTFSSDREGGARSLWWKPADGSGTAERLTTAERNQNPNSWSPDGRHLLFRQYQPDGSASDLFVLTLAEKDSSSEKSEIRPFIQTPFNEWDAEFSPDGNWVAYASEESGLPEVFVVPFPGSGGKWQVSITGALAPAWSRDGRKLFFADFEGNLLEVDVDLKNGFGAGTPRVVLTGIDLVRARNLRDYAVSPDGKRFLVTERTEVDNVFELSRLRVVLNWLDILRTRPDN